MSNGLISKITTIGGSTYDIKDAAAREQCTYVSSQVSANTEAISALSDAIRQKVFVSDNISGISGYSDLSVIKLSANEYASLLTSDQLLSNALYVVEDEYEDMYGMQVKNVAYPTDLSDAATKGYVDDVVSGIQIPTDLSAFTNSPGYLISSDVSISYSSQTIWLSSKSYVTSVDCTDFIKDGMLSSAELCGTTLVMTFNTDAESDPISVELSNFIDDYDDKISTLSDAVDNKVFVSDNISGISGYSDLSVVKLGADEYASMLTSSQLLSNTLYIVENSCVNAYGQQLKNLAAPTDLSDAATKGYVDDAVSSIQIPTDLSAFTNSPGYLVSNDISDYYKKSETSSASEISNALSTKADLSSVEHVVQYEQDYAEDYTAVTIGSRFEEVANHIGAHSFVNGMSCAATGTYAHAEGNCTSALTWAHAEGSYTKATDYSAHAEGSYTWADGDSSHAEGNQTSAFGMNSHAEGEYTCAENHASHAEGYGTIASNEGAHAEGGYTSAFGYFSHTEGGWSSTGEYAIGAHAEGGFSRADGPISHVEGVKATAELSDYQSFVWQGTDVMPNELTDITPSTWDEYKAHGPGTFNINPVSGLSGVWIGETRLADIVGNAEHLESIEYSELLQLRDEGQLIPGMKYRIIDYMTTVDQEDCRSAEHPFDLIVTAIDHYTLDEHAIATLPSNADGYFDAREFHVPAYTQYLEYKRVPLESWDIKYCLDNDKSRFAWADTENGKGVIYYMKDEFGNEAPYDFKNVQFKRYEITAITNWDEEKYGTHDLIGTYGLPVGNIEVDSESYMWCYTFNGADYSEKGLSEPYDFSGWHISPTDAVLSQFSGANVRRLNNCCDNVISKMTEESDTMLLNTMKLPNNVFQCALDVTVSGVPEPLDQLLKIGICAANKFGTNCNRNTFGSDCNRNTFGSDCDSNTFGNNCDSNTFGNTCNSNTFGIDCNSNTFGNYCNSNTFGIDCDSNTFGSDCDSNTFGNYCNSNTFGNNCNSNTFGNNCNSNTFGDYCDSNTFGSDCIYIKFAISSSDPSQVKNYYKYINIDSGNQYILLNCTQSRYDGNEYKNVHILPGVNNTTTFKTITDSNVNQSFCTTYQPANSQVIAI